MSAPTEGNHRAENRRGEDHKVEDHRGEDHRHRVSAGAERTLVILNPHSGRDRAGRQKTKLLRALSDAGLIYDLVETIAPGQGIELARQAVADGYTTVVAAGGDGTINEVVNGLVRGSAGDQSVGKLAILSVGSGNDFARTLGISQDPRAAAQAIAKGTARTCDLGHVVIQAGGTTD
ncbi:MAG: acylglycerol kinase family protein [Caldilineaceae bacterium]